MLWPNLSPKMLSIFVHSKFPINRSKIRTEFLQRFSEVILGKCTAICCYVIWEGSLSKSSTIRSREKTFLRSCIIGLFILSGLIPSLSLQQHRMALQKQKRDQDLKEQREAEKNSPARKKSSAASSLLCARKSNKRKRHNSPFKKGKQTAERKF